MPMMRRLWLVAKNEDVCLKKNGTGISGRVVGIHPGPVITLFEYEPDVGSKVNKIVALEDDLAMQV